MDDYGDALEPLQQLIKELTTDGAWLFGPEGKALAKLPSPGFAWQGRVIFPIFNFKPDRA